MAGQFEPLEMSLGGLVGGMDEAGRGALAGPVSVGLAVFEPAFFMSAPVSDLARLDDSKRLAPAVRERLLPAVQKHALFSACVMISSRAIDVVGINPATEQAMILLVRRWRRFLQNREISVGGSAPSNTFDLLIDGNYRFQRLQNEPGVRACQSIIRGDSRVFSIAAASILAKVLRDRRMIRYERLFPGYGLAGHKGYGTELHRNAISRLGMSPIHRKSYASQLSLFSQRP